MEPADGLAALRKALEAEPLRSDLRYQLAHLLFREFGDAAGALEELQELYRRDPGHAEGMALYARLLLDFGKALEASEVLKIHEGRAPREGRAVRGAVLGLLRQRIEDRPDDVRARFLYGQLCLFLGELELAIVEFRKTRNHPEYELKSYDMLGQAFAKKSGYGMKDLAIKQFRKGLEARGHAEHEYLELRYNLAMLLYSTGKLHEALKHFRDIYAVDIAYRDVKEWIDRIEVELDDSDIWGWW